MCRACGGNVRQLGRGRPRIYCASCASPKYRPVPVALLRCESCDACFRGPARTRRFCSEECKQALAEWEKRVPCAGGCGRRLFQGPGPLMRDQPKCRPCRRAERMANCTACGVQFERSAPSSNQATCGRQCPAKARPGGDMRRRPRTTGTTTERGYGHDHQRERARWAPLVAAGQVICWRCGYRIPPGSLWDLGHDDQDRSVYRGPEHRRCNRAAAARAKNKGKRNYIQSSSSGARPATAARW
jgi:hypothetical protein